MIPFGWSSIARAGFVPFTLLTSQSAFSWRPQRTLQSPRALKMRGTFIDLVLVVATLMALGGCGGSSSESTPEPNVTTQTTPTNQTTQTTQTTPTNQTTQTTQTTQTSQTTPTTQTPGVAESSETKAITAPTDILTFKSVSMASPVALNRRAVTNAEEPVAMTLAVAGSSSNVTYAIASNPAHGKLSGSGAERIYSPDAGFSGEDTFTYTASDGQKMSTATVKIAVVDDLCKPDQFKGPTDGLQLYLANQMASKEISSNRFKVKTTTTGSWTSPEVGGWSSRTNLSAKRIDVLLTKKISARTISFKFVPNRVSQAGVLLQAGDFRVQQDLAGGISATIPSASGGSTTTIANRQSSLKIPSCNSVVITMKDQNVAVYLNGKKVEQAGVSALAELSNALTVGSYPGRVWDVRVYDRVLSDGELQTLYEDCGDTKAWRDADYPNRLCSTYMCLAWPNGTASNDDQYRSLLYWWDRVWEGAVLEAGVYPRKIGLCKYYASVQKTHDMRMDDEYCIECRKAYLGKYGFDQDPLTEANFSYLAHELFHRFQYISMENDARSGDRDWIESTADWFVEHNAPAHPEQMRGFYSLMPHLPMWVVGEDSSPWKEVLVGRAGKQWAGGHTYGAAIWHFYLTHYVARTPRLIGDLSDDVQTYPRSYQSTGAQASQYTWLASAGYDMREVFGDFAARITTWDLDQSEKFIESENNARRNLKKDARPGEVADAKIVTTYDQAGTQGQWKTVPHEFEPGGWAFNAYQINVAQAGSYTVNFSPSANNPEYAEFRERIVVYDPATKTRTYYAMPIAKAGQEIGITNIDVGAGKILYLVVASTPSNMFGGTDFYSYSYKVTRQ